MPGQRWKRKIPLFEIDALLAEADKEIRTRVRIEDRLKRYLALVHFKRRAGLHRIVAADADEIADYRNVGIKNFRRRGLRTGVIGQGSPRYGSRRSLCHGCGRRRGFR